MIAKESIDQLEKSIPRFGYNRMVFIDFAPCIGTQCPKIMQ